MVWLQAHVLVRHGALHKAIILNRVVSNEGDKHTQIASVGILHGMQQVWKAHAWVVDRRTQLCVDAVMAIFHCGRGGKKSARLQDVTFSSAVPCLNLMTTHSDEKI
jgi:hypothetical protein